MSMSELQTGQQEIFDYVKNNLGEGMIDVEQIQNTIKRHLQGPLIGTDNAVIQPKFKKRYSKIVPISNPFPMNLSIALNRN